MALHYGLTSSCAHLLKFRDYLQQSDVRTHYKNISLSSSHPGLYFSFEGPITLSIGSNTLFMKLKNSQCGILDSIYYQQQNMKKQQDGSDEELNEEINDKLNELWTGMNDKRKQLVRNMTPGYSRRTDQSELNQSSMQFAAENQLLKLRQKLASEVSNNKQKDMEIQNLKKTITQLTNDKKMLVYELQQVCNSQNMNSSLLNESSINNSKLEFNKNTANFSTGKKAKKSKQFATIEQERDQTIDLGQKHPFHGNLQDLSKNRLIQLLRSTAQYRQFVFYYDSHELSYLKKLQEQHKRNCDHTASLKEKANWAPTQIYQQFKRINIKQKWGMDNTQIQTVISIMKNYYQRNYQQRIRKNKTEYGNKLKKVQRENQYGMPYDLVQVCRAKERQLSKIAKRTKTNSFI